MKRNTIKTNVRKDAGIFRRGGRAAFAVALSAVMAFGAVPAFALEEAQPADSENAGALDSASEAAAESLDAAIILAEEMVADAAEPCLASVNPVRELSGLSQEGASASGDSAEGKASGASETAEETYSVTVYHSEIMYYDDPTYVPEDNPNLAGVRLLKAITLDGFKAGDVVRAHDYIGRQKGFTFFDGWPRELVVSEDEGKNAIYLDYFRDRSDCTVNHFLVSEADEAVDGGNGAQPSGQVLEEDPRYQVTKMATETLSNQLFADTLDSQSFADISKLADGEEVPEGMALVGAYPQKLQVAVDPQKNQINLFYADTAANLPDDVPAGEADGGQGGSGDGSDSAPGDGSGGNGGAGAEGPGNGAGSDNGASGGSGSNGGSGSGGNSGAGESDGAASGGNGSAEGEGSSGDGASQGPASDGSQKPEAGNGSSAAGQQGQSAGLPQTGDGALAIIGSLGVLMAAAVIVAIAARARRHA